MFISKSVGVALHSQLLSDKYFIHYSELETNYSPKRLVVKVLNNPINFFFFFSQSKHYLIGIFSLNIY